MSSPAQSVIAMQLTAELARARAELIAANAAAIESRVAFEAAQKGHHFSTKVTYRALLDDMQRAISASLKESDLKAQQQMITTIYEWCKAGRESAKANDPESGIPDVLNPLIEPEIATQFDEFEKQYKIRNELTPDQRNNLFILLFAMVANVITFLSGMGVRIDAQLKKNSIIANSADAFAYRDQESDGDLQRAADTGDVTSDVILMQRQGDRMMIATASLFAFFSMLYFLSKQKFISQETKKNLTELTDKFIEMCKSIKRNDDAPEPSHEFKEKLTKLIADLQQGIGAPGAQLAVLDAVLGDGDLDSKRPPSKGTRKRSSS